MKIANATGGTVILTDPQCKVAAGDEIEVPDALAQALLKRGFRKARPPKADKDTTTRTAGKKED